jgi:hypothetical protein
MTPRLGGVQGQTNGCQQHTRALNFFLFGILDAAEGLPDTLVHGTPCQHPQLEELVYELDETVAMSPGVLCGTIFVRAEVLLATTSYLGCHLVCSGRFDRPTTFEIFLATIKQVLAEEVATSDRLAILIIAYTVVSNAWCYVSGQGGTRTREVSEGRGSGASW